MKAVIDLGNGEVEVRDVPAPTAPPAGHLVIKMETSEINPGDKFFLGKAPMSITRSRHDIWGVSGTGRVTAMGSGVPVQYDGQQVILYRSLTGSKDIFGAWSEYAQLPYLSCAIVPKPFHADSPTSVSLVNVITPYAFAQDALGDGHKAFVATAGSSATGLALVGVSEALKIPVIAIVRDSKSKNDLEKLGAKYVLSRADTDFTKNLAALTTELNATAIFDGVGGDFIGEIAPSLAMNSTIYAYGYLGGMTPIAIAPPLFMAKNLTLKSFSNFRSTTVTEPKKMTEALREIGGIISLPHFQSRVGKTFRLEQIREALAFTGTNQGKAQLRIG